MGRVTLSLRFKAVLPVIVLCSFVWTCIVADGQEQSESLSRGALNVMRDRACLAQCHGGEHQVEIDGQTASTVDLAVLRTSSHARLACIDCHQSITSIPHNGGNQPVQCVGCHYKGNPREAPYNAQRRDYAESVHGQMTEDDGKKRPGCADCHGTHDILPASQSQSRVHRTHTAETCGQCHDKEYQEYATSVHGKALLWDAVMDSPGCVDCHGVHRILSPTDPRSSVFPTHVSQTCANCHEAVEIVGKYGLSTQRVVSYDESYHGLANKYGTRAVANCASCHGVHDILPSTDPMSSIHPANLHATCGQEDCHPNAVSNFTTGRIHLGIVPTPHDIVRWIEWIYICLIILIIGGMILHNILYHMSSRRRNHGTHD